MDRWMGVCVLLTGAAGGISLRERIAARQPAAHLHVCMHDVCVVSVCDVRFNSASNREGWGGVRWGWCVSV